MVVVYLCSLSQMQVQTSQALQYYAAALTPTSILVVVTLAVTATLYMRPTITHVVQHYVQTQTQAQATKLAAN